MAKNTPGQREFNTVQIKSPVLLKREIINDTNILVLLHQILANSFSTKIGNFLA